MWRDLLSQARKIFETAKASENVREAYTQSRDAIELYKKAVEEYCRVETNREDRGEINLLEIMSQETGSVYGFVGNLHMLAGQDERATQFYEEALRMLPEKQKADILVGRAVIKKRKKDYRGAIDDINLVLMIAPEKEAQCHYNLGLIGIDQENYNHAKRELRKAIKINPRFAIAYSHLGDVHRAFGNISAARRDYEKALEIISEKRKNELSMMDYRGAIRAEIGLVCHLHHEREPVFSRRALAKGVLSEKEIKSLTHFKGVDVQTKYPL